MTFAYTASEQEIAAWYNRHVVALQLQAQQMTEDLLKEVERSYQTLQGFGGEYPLLADPALSAKAYDQIRELRAGLRRLQRSLAQGGIAPLEEGRRRRAAEDGRGSGPLPLGYRLGALDEDRSQKSARGARWQIEIDPRGAQIVLRIFTLHQQGIPPQEIAISLYESGLGMPARTTVVAQQREIRMARRAGQHELADELAKRLEQLPATRFLGIKQIEQVLAHEELYRTGKRVWDGIEAAIRWPAILPQ